MEENNLGIMQQRATELEHMAEVLLTGEQLRLRLHEEKIIKDRRHHLKTYPNCFVAKELIDWLIDHKEASDREMAIKLVQKLLDRSIIHHVCDEHKEFKDLKLFYRFRKDDGTFPLDNEVKAFMRGQRLYEKLMNTENALLQAREEEGIKYERTFMASQLIDWLIQEGEVTTRSEAEQLGRRLLEHGIIQHVSNKHHFVDSNLLFQFRMNFRRRRRLMELLAEKSRQMPESHDSPFCLRKQNHDNKKHTSFLSVSPTKEIKIISAVRRSSMSSCGSSGYFSSSPTLSSSPPVLCNPKSVLKRPVTPDELLMPGAPYARKTFTIVGDAVGWGFVVRGSKPCHVQAVDPSGPAAAAGMKVTLITSAKIISKGRVGALLACSQAYVRPLEIDHKISLEELENHKDNILNKSGNKQMCKPPSHKCGGLVVFALNLCRKFILKIRSSFRLGTDTGPGLVEESVLL
uniref:DEP domain containing MTOR interacting protein n=1 Tax=Anolis carolinensis TaxID=28377 RepID=A0A803T438_ANOCA